MQFVFGLIVYKMELIHVFVCEKEKCVIVM